MSAKGRQGQRPDQRWENLISRLTADNPHWSIRKIWMQLSMENELLPYPIPGDPPTRKTIDKRVKELRSPENKALLDSRRSVYFPETFESGDLPGESAPVIMGFMRVYPSLQKLDGSVRPSIREAEWFYRIRLMAPDAPLQSVISLAGLGAITDAMTNGGTWVNRVIEAYVYFEPWEKPEDFHVDKDMSPALVRSELFKDYVESLEFDVSDKEPSDKMLFEMGVTSNQYRQFQLRSVRSRMEGNTYSFPKLLMEVIGG